MVHAESETLPDIARPEVEFAVTAFEEHVVSTELEFAIKALSAPPELFSIQTHVAAANLSEALEQAGSFGCKSKHSQRLRDIASTMLDARRAVGGETVDAEPPAAATGSVFDADRVRELLGRLEGELHASDVAPGFMALLAAACEDPSNASAAGGGDSSAPLDASDGSGVAEGGGDIASAPVADGAHDGEGAGNDDGGLADTPGGDGASSPDSLDQAATQLQAEASAHLQVSDSAGSNDDDHGDGDVATGEHAVGLVTSFWGRPHVQHVDVSSSGSNSDDIVDSDPEVGDGGGGLDVAGFSFTQAGGSPGAREQHTAVDAVADASNAEVEAAVEQPAGSVVDVEVVHAAVAEEPSVVASEQAASPLHGEDDASAAPSDTTPPRISPAATFQPIVEPQRGDAPSTTLVDTVQGLSRPSPSPSPPTAGTDSAWQPTPRTSDARASTSPGTAAAPTRSSGLRPSPPGGTSTTPPVSKAALARRRAATQVQVQLCQALAGGSVSGCVGAMDLTTVDLTALDDALEEALRLHLVRPHMLRHTPMYLRSLALRRQRARANPHATSARPSATVARPSGSPHGMGLRMSPSSGNFGSDDSSDEEVGAQARADDVWRAIRHRVRVLVARACHVRRLRAALLWGDWDEAQEAAVSLEAFLDNQPPVSPPPPTRPRSVAGRQSTHAHRGSPGPLGEPLTDMRGRATSSPDPRSSPPPSGRTSVGRTSSPHMMRDDDPGALWCSGCGVAVCVFRLRALPRCHTHRSCLCEQALHASQTSMP